MTICLAILLSIFAIISLRKLEWGIFFVVFTLPCYLLRLKIFGVPTTVLELEIYTLFLMWLIKQLQVLSFRFQVQNTIKLLFVAHCSLFIAIFLVLTGAVLSAIFSSDLKTSVGILRGWFFDPLLFGVISAATIKSKKQIENIFGSLMISGVFVAIIAFFYYFFGYLTFDGRLRAFFLSPNHLAMYLAPCFLVATYNLLHARAPKETGQASTVRGGTGFFKYLWMIGAFLVAAALYFTYSYSTWLGILGALFFLNLFLPLRKRRIFGFSGLIILIILLFCLQSGSPKLQNLIESPRSSSQSRLMVWQAAFKIARDNLFLGIGPGMFQKYYLDYQKHFPPYLEWAVPQPHNLFLAFWLQTGIFGLIGFIWLMTWFFRRGFARLTINPAPEQARYGAGNYQLKTILMSVMVYILFHGLVDTTYWKNDLSLVFWLVVFLMLVVSGIKKESPDN